MFLFFRFSFSIFANRSCGLKIINGWKRRFVKLLEKLVGCLKNETPFKVIKSIETSPIYGCTIKFGVFSKPDVSL